MQNQLDLNSLQLVQRLQQAGSFTAAAEQLGCSKTTLSLQLKALEQQLGVALFRRTTRQLSLTRAGEQLLRDCMPLLDELQQALQQVDGGIAVRRQAQAGPQRRTGHCEFLLALQVAGIGLLG